jgi:hypothetical protein
MLHCSIKEVTMYPFALPFVELIAGLVVGSVLALTGLLVGDVLIQHRLGNPINGNHLQLDVEGLIKDLTSFA